MTTWSRRMVAIAVAAAVCLAVVIAPLAAEAQQQTSKKCSISLSNISINCFAVYTETPTADCCDAIKGATTTQVRCLCDVISDNYEYANFTQPYLSGLFDQCGVPSKLSCSGAGAANKISSLGVIGLFATLFVTIFY